MPLAMETPTGAEIAVVETNSFHQVLGLFNDQGILNNKYTRFAIECQICCGKDLGLINSEFDEFTDERHEEYTVLPRCGHGFGYHCLDQWMKADYSLDHNPTCPSCRAPIMCEKLHDMAIPKYGSHNSQDQGKQITEIRTSLLKVDCTECHELQQRVNAQQAGRNNNQVSLEAIQARREAIRARMQVGTTEENRNRDSYSDIEYELSRMHSMIEIANRRGGPGADTLDIWFAQDNVENAIRQQRDLGQIEEQISRIEDMAEGRIERQRQRAEAAQRILAQIATLQAELQESIYL